MVEHVTEQHGAAHGTHIPSLAFPLLRDFLKGACLLCRKIPTASLSSLTIPHYGHLNPLQIFLASPHKIPGNTERKESSVTYIEMEQFLRHNVNNVNNVKKNEERLRWYDVIYVIKIL